jgi:hypothetical protein
LVAVAPAVAFSISPRNAHYEQWDVRLRSGVDIDIARSIEMGASHDKIVDTAKLLDEDTRLPPRASGRGA